MDLKYLGWERYQDSGRPRRTWLFLNDVPELEAKADSWLYDRGPGENRFAINDKGLGEIRIVSDEDVYEWFPKLGLLRWIPPREGEEKIVEAVDAVAAQLRDLQAAVRSAGSGRLAEKKLGVIEGILGRNGKKPETKATDSYLRLQFDGQYDNGDPYRDYVFLADVPRIPATRTRLVEGPRHAIRGDLLRVIDDGDRFSLRRGNKKIGSPEWWQRREISGGLALRGKPKEEEQEGDAVDVMPPHHMRAFALLGEGRCNCAHIVERDIPEVGIKAGDVVVYAYGPEFPEMGGRVRFLSMDDYAALKAATLESYRETFAPLTDSERKMRFGLLDNSRNHRWVMWPENQWQMEDLYKFLKCANKWGKKLKVWHSRLAVIRSGRSPVSEPVHASSDDAALFELIYSTGGRMPEA